MRAIQSTHRRRIAAGLVTASILALAVVGGTATAANSRIFWVGSNLVDANGVIINPDPNGVPGNNGKLIPTAVNAGLSTAIPVQLKSGDNQTIAHVVFNFPASGTLPTGLAITAIGGPDAAACPTIDPAAPADSVTCNFNNMAGFGLRSFFLVVSTTAQTFATPANPLFTAQATTNNENGSNLQLFTADSGAFNVQAPNDNGLSTFVAPGHLRQEFKTTGVAGTNKLQTTLDFNQSADGNLVSIAETDSGSAQFLYTCPAGQTCQPVETTVSVQDGLSGNTTQFGSPFLQVTLQALVPKTYTLSKAFVAHYGADFSKPDWIIFWNTKSNKCASNPATTLANADACFQNATLSKPDANGFETLTLIVLMKHNGGMRL